MSDFQEGSLFLRYPVSAQDQTSGGTFFCCGICTQGSGPRSVAVSEDQYSPLHGDSSAVFAPSDCKSEGWERIGNIDLDNPNQISKLETFRSRASLQVYNKSSKTARLESNVYTGANILFLSIITPTFFFYQDNHSKQIGFY